VAGRDQVDEQDHVGALALHGAELAAVLAVQALAGVGPDDQQVHRPAGRRRGHQAGQVDGGDLADPQPRVAVPAGHHDRHQHGQHQNPDRDDPLPPPPQAHRAPWCGAGGAPGRSATGCPARAAAM
jgi:hypothetical protein